MRERQTGFTVVELVAVIIIVVMLAAIAIPTLFGNKGQANTVRSKDAAGALNAAEGAWYEYRTKSGPALTGVRPVPDTYSMNAAQRISNLQTGGYLETSVDPGDVQLSTNSDPPQWSPAYP